MYIFHPKNSSLPQRTRRFEIRHMKTLTFTDLQKLLLSNGHSWHSIVRLSFLLLDSSRRIPRINTMWPSSGNSSEPQAKRQEKKSISGSFRAENLIPGIVIGFIIGMILDLAQQVKSPVKRSRLLSSKIQKRSSEPSKGGDQELKMVLVVRQDLKMRTGKIASQCAHAATGMYSELMQSDRYLLRRWEECGQPKIVVTCKNQQEMNKITEAAESVGLPTFVVADAGRTEVAAGSRTVLAVGPGPKELVDSVTGRLALL